MSAVVKTFRAATGTDAAGQAKKISTKLAALDSRIDGLVVRADEIDGGEDPAGVVAAGVAVATARAERVVLARALEAARAVEAAEVVAEKARQAEARINGLVAECEVAGDELQAALVEVCSHLGRFTVLTDTLLHANRLRFGLEHYCRAASAISCKNLVIPWGEERSHERVVDIQLTVPLVPIP